MGFSGVKKKTGKSYDFYEKMSINWTSFGGGASDGYGPDMIIPFTTQGIFFLNEETTATKIIQYSLNGFDVHGELTPMTPTQGLAFDVRVVSLIWFRIKPGAVSPAEVSVHAWAF